MRIKRGWLWVVAVTVATLFIPSTNLFAQGTSQERGLFITPPRQYQEVAAGQEVKKEFTVGNTNDQVMKVQLSVEQFSVADYTYDYTFRAAEEKWVQLSTSQLELGSKESRKIAYTLAPPSSATPGGHYFSILASATLNDGKQIRTALVLYVTVGGELVRSSEIVKGSVPSVWFGGDIPVAFDIKNTGNTHFFIYTTSKLNGWFSDWSTPEVAHILLPQTTRSIGASVPPPLLPGIYNVTYGYKTEAGEIYEQKKSVIYAPVWFFALLIGAIWVVVVIVKRNKRLSRWLRRY